MTCGSSRSPVLTCACNCDDCNKYGRECWMHGDVCGACGASITEAAQAGDGEGPYHKRDEDCRAVQLMAF